MDDGLDADARAMRAEYWVMIGDIERANAEPSAESLEGWRQVARLARDWYF